MTFLVISVILALVIRLQNLEKPAIGGGCCGSSPFLSEIISKIKEERNKAQDKLAELRKILELSDDISLTEHITKIKINIDKE